MPAVFPGLPALAGRLPAKTVVDVYDIMSLECFLNLLVRGNAMLMIRSHG
jgi:hypothetical protein